MRQRVGPKDYPLWVRVLVRQTDPRSRIWMGVYLYVGLAVAGIATFWAAVLFPWSKPGCWLPDPVDRAVPAVVASGMLVLALWWWRAIRWVDRYGTWADGWYPDDDESGSEEPG